MKTAVRILACLAAAALVGLGTLAAGRFVPWSGQTPAPSGSITVQTVQAEADAAQRRMVVPSGAPFGVKMFTRGVIVVGLSDVTSGGQRQNPARRAGLETGDVILAIDGEAVNGNKMLGQKVAASGGEPLQLVVQREEARLELTLCPVLADAENTWRAGVWVRDSSAGIGTMTYWDPESGSFGGLGHAICDVDTGELMPLNSGQVVGVEITNLEKGRSGDPGELQGSFLNHEVLGELTANTETGIYGTAVGGDAEYLGGGKAIPVATAHEVQPGPAVILTTLAGSTPAQYEVEIERVNTAAGSTRNLVLHVTDPQLLARAGGIVQGMSGSPIIQNGKLVGAVTHVLVNDPTRGYGILVEAMLDAAG